MKRREEEEEEEEERERAAQERERRERRETFNGADYGDEAFEYWRRSSGAVRENPRMFPSERRERERERCRHVRARWSLSSWKKKNTCDDDDDDSRVEETSGGEREEAALQSVRGREGREQQQ